MRRTIECSLYVLNPGIDKEPVRKHCRRCLTCQANVSRIQSPATPSTDAHSAMTRALGRRTFSFPTGATGRICPQRQAGNGTSRHCWRWSRQCLRRRCRPGPILLPATFRCHLLRIRTHVEHRLHDLPCEPSVLVENLDFPELLLLRNNPQVFQYARPTVPWHEIPKLCCADRERFLGANERYLFRSHGEFFCQYFLACKNSAARPVLHGRSHDDPETTGG